ncbi:uncharacterized protein EV154DRAFT_602345 [Mucor mucedo]|uniref:uncharacterized protein n=1 Tax=Mucor mucedo TaxID=29922 RepID=UPI00221EC3DA|nr:uncharacterized protein EV154DRAFT_602345 [Mucor mucedo]KAI7891638.1 hypothetical protein EV154DRAFT_602345 [Mucor mucedo]
MDDICDYCGNGLTEWDYMTECGHVICGPCYHRHNRVCPICKKPCKFALIGDQTPYNGAGFLKPVKTLMNDSENIVNFQLSCLTRLVGVLRSKLAKQKEILNQVKHELSLVTEYKREIHRLRQENEYLKSKIRSRGAGN